MDTRYHMCVSIFISILLMVILVEKNAFFDDICAGRNLCFTILSTLILAFGAGFMHDICTLFACGGISFAKKKRKLLAISTLGLHSTAIVYHGIYNILIQSNCHCRKNQQTRR